MNYAYLAGLLDGEGSIMLLKNGAHRCRRVQIAISITERRVLEEIKQNYGGFISDHGTVPQWRLNGTPAIQLLKDVRPFLIIKRRQELADLIILDTILPLNHVSYSKVPHTDTLFKEMKKLNALRAAKPPILDKQQPTDANFSYLAGILDGEGHISFKTRRIEVVSTDAELPAWLASRFGGRIHLGARAKGNHRTTWRWLRSPTGCTWAAEVADEMRLARKSDELRKMQDFTRTPAPPSEDGDYLLYARLRGEGVLPAVARREAGVSIARAGLLDRAIKGL